MKNAPSRRGVDPLPRRRGSRFRVLKQAGNREANVILERSKEDSQDGDGEGGIWMRDMATRIISPLLPSKVSVSDNDRRLTRQSTGGTETF